MKRTPLSLSLSAALLLLIPGCESGKPTAEQKSTAPASNAVQAPGTVVTRPSGLRYQVLTSGPADGKHPTLSDSVTVHYKGTLTNGTQFDSSYDRGTPATFGVGQVIPGWTEALMLMKPGDQWMLYLPANIAYGAQSMGGIPANSDLIFKVHLISITPGF